MKILSKFALAILAGTALAVAALPIKPALAGDELTITSWGGAYQESQRKAYFEPFMKEGNKVTEEEYNGEIAKLRAMWHALPTPMGKQPDLARTDCIVMRDFVVRIRKHTAMEFAAPVVNGLSAYSQPLLNWKYRQFNSHRRDLDRAALRMASDPP